MEITAIALFVAGMVLGNTEILFGDFEQSHYIYPNGRVLLSLSLMLFYFRILQFFVVSRTLGLKVFMVYRMVSFSLKFGVFLLPYERFFMRANYKSYFSLKFSWSNYSYFWRFSSFSLWLGELHNMDYSILTRN